MVLMHSYSHSDRMAEYSGYVIMSLVQWSSGPVVIAAWTLAYIHTLLPSAAAAAGRRPSSLVKCSSSEFKGSTVGPVRSMLCDGDVSRSFMTLDSFLPFFLFV